MGPSDRSEHREPQEGGRGTEAGARPVPSVPPVPRDLDDIRHELKSPLTSLKLYLALLETGPPERRAHYLAALRTEVDRLAALVDAIGRTDRGPDG